MKASVNKNTCIGCSICIDICPGIFEFDPQGISEATTTFISPRLEHDVRAAADACPTQAISVM
ncbi:MAG: 4Fe-4S binding protein [uncultured bacterium]|nr:MAG: 4Fe-4S binding protein [uncultured bacterium]HBH19152.1 ferredoxin [Cyanobacteria bacterium UBA9579]